MAALALHDALCDCAPRLGPLLKLKWPNDVLLGPDKLAGILIEGESEPAFAVVIGFGVNCAGHPPDMPFPATDLLTAGAVVAPDALLAALSAAMLRRLAQWRGGEGFASIRTDWLARAAGLGEDIRVRLPEREMRGRFRGLDEAGRLQVEQPDGLVDGHRRRSVWPGRDLIMAQATPELVFAPLGGVGEIGMNLSIYGLGAERRRQWLAVDLGVSFASEEHLPGVDLILPDIRYLVAERKNLAGLVITHAHEDHYGAILDLWPKLKVPIFATPFTAALLAAKRASEPGAPEIPVTIVPLGSRFKVGPFDVEMVSMAHSIPEANALIIRTPAGAVLHTGDWKIDPTPILGDVTDEKKLRALGEEGCLAIVGDSTNAVRDGRSPSEKDVAKTIAELVAQRARAASR